MDSVKKRMKMPHTYVILFSIVILAAIASYTLPAGVYDRSKDPATGRTLVNPASYHHVEQTPVSPFDLFKAIPRGMVAGADIVFFIFICGGAFTVIQATGAVNSGLARFIMKLRGYENLLIPLTMLLFSVFGFTMGMSEEVIVFIPIGVLLARALKYDDIVAVSMLSTGAAIGFASGLLNPFTVGVAQTIAELKMFSGLEFRIIGFVFLYLSGVIYTMNYAKKVRANPEYSYVYEEMQKNKEVGILDESVQFTGVHQAVALVCLAFLGVMIYGVMKLDFYITELAAVFLAMGIVGGLVGRLGPNQIAMHFVAGCRDIVFGALVVGVARAILVVLQDGQIIDTIIHGLANGVSIFPKGLAAVGMFWVQSIINFFIPSGSGQAAATMPIMAPLADLLGITRQTAVLAFHYGDGFSNSIIPTSASLMGVLAMAHVPYEKWFRFIWPLMVIWTIIGSVMCYIAAVINLGPF